MIATWLRARLAAWLLLAGLALLLSAQARAQDRPYIPASDAVVLEHLPSTRDPRVRAFDALRRARTSAPRNPKLAIELARSYLDYGRATGDARFLGRAQAVIAPLLAVKSPSPDVLLLEATLLQSRQR